MANADPRAALDALIRKNGDDYASISRLLRRNAAYIQQYIRRGTPRKLDEEDRAALARYFGVAEEVLGGRGDGVARIAPAAKARSSAAGLVSVPSFAIGASAGPGAFADDERPRAQIAFQAKWLRSLAGGGPSELSIIQVEGDSMTPALSDGDDIMVDRADAADRLRDGIYVLRMDDALLVKRLALNPANRRLAITSDNPAYQSWPDCDPAVVEVIGRVIWAGRRIR